MMQSPHFKKSTHYANLAQNAILVRVVLNFCSRLYILRKDPPPQCEHCPYILTVRHILVECNYFAEERKDIFGERNVAESFSFQPTHFVVFKRVSAL